SPVGTELPYARNARLNIQPLAVMRVVLFHDEWHFRARTYQRHLSPEYVDQLWQFIQARPSKKSSYSCDPRVCGLLRMKTILGGIDVHGTKLIKTKRGSPSADTILGEQNWPR